MQSAEFESEKVRVQPSAQTERGDDHRQQGFAAFDEGHKVDGEEAGEGEGQVDLAADGKSRQPATTLGPDRAEHGDDRIACDQRDGEEHLVAAPRGGDKDFRGASGQPWRELAGQDGAGQDDGKQGFREAPSRSMQNAFGGVA